MLPIVTIQTKSGEKFLRKKTARFDFSKSSKKEIDDLVKNMRETMKKANGIGLAANQVGLDMRMFVAQLPARIKADLSADKRRSGIGENQRRNLRESASFVRFYAIFNPEILKKSKEISVTDEGCLSVPGGYYGDVERPEKIILDGFDKNGKRLKIKAWGLLARVFQHEVDHLDGTLFIDKARNLRQITNDNDEEL